MNLDSIVAKEGILQKIGKGIQKGAKHVKNNFKFYSLLGLATIATACSSCDPEEDEFDHEIYGNNSGPNGAKVELFDDGYKLGSTNITGNKYTILDISKKVTETYDSLVVTAADHNKQVIKNIVVNDRKNVEVNLEEIAKLFSLYGTESTANATGEVFDEGNKLADITTDADGKYNSAEMNLPSDLKLDSIVVVKDNVIKKYTNVNVSDGSNKFEFNIENPTYQHNFNVAAYSDINGKEIGGGLVGLVLNSEVNDTIWNTIVNQATAFTKITENNSEGYTLVFKQVPGHENKEVTGTSTGTVNENVELIGIIYNANIPIQVTEQGTSNGVAGATVDDTETTNEEGKTTITRNNLETDINNIPLTSYATNVSVSKAGYIPKSEELTYVAGENNEKTIEIEKEIINNQYNLDLIITDVLGDNILNGKTINVKEPDGDIQTKIVSSKNTSFLIEGTYDNGQKIKIWLTPDSEYDGLTGTINQSLKLPLTSVFDPNETKSDTLAIVIGDVDNKTAYVSFMDKTTRDDPLIRELVSNDGGNTEWNYLNGSGEREKTYVIVQTNKQGGAVPQNIQDWYQDAINIMNHYLTDQGLQIMRTNTETQTEYPTAFIPGKIFLTVDNDAPTPGNAKIGNYPETYNAGIVEVVDSESRGTIISETWGVDAGKEYNPDQYIQFDPIGGGSITGLNDKGLKSFRIIQMYDGLTIPDPTP